MKKFVLPSLVSKLCTLNKRKNIEIYNVQMKN